MNNTPRVTNCDHLTTDELKAICSAVHKDIMHGVSDVRLTADEEELSEEYQYYANALEKRITESSRNEEA